jgi:dienelactone hydrolase
MLETWQRDSHTADGTTHDTYRKGSGPGVVVIHELPGITPEVIAFAEEVVAQGHTVMMPQLFGIPGAEMGVRSLAGALTQVCISREFTKLALNETSPIAGWLRSLARELDATTGGGGIGVVGMCFTGGFALAMMVDPCVAAPVVAQPSVPFPLGRRRKADLNLSPADLAVVRRRAAGGCSVLGLRYRDDPSVGDRFTTLRRELGDNFLAVGIPGRKHSTLTAHRQQVAVDAVLAFLRERLGQVR